MLRTNVLLSVFGDRFRKLKYSVALGRNDYNRGLMRHHNKQASSYGRAMAFSSSFRLYVFHLHLLLTERRRFVPLPLDKRICTYMTYHHSHFPTFLLFVPLNVIQMKEDQDETIVRLAAICVRQVLNDDNFIHYIESTSLTYQLILYYRK